MKLSVWIKADCIGSKCEREVEIEDEDLEGLTTQERQAYFHECAQDEIWEMAEWGWKECK